MTKLNYQTNFSLHAGVPATRNERRRGQLSFIVQVSVAGRGTLAGGGGYSLEFGMGMCRTVLKALTLFHLPKYMIFRAWFVLFLNQCPLSMSK